MSIGCHLFFLFMLCLITDRKTHAYGPGCSSYVVLENDHVESCNLTSVIDPEDENENHKVPQAIGDVLPEEDTLDEFRGIEKRKVPDFVSKRIWPLGIIPYRLAKGMRRLKERKSVIYLKIALKHWETYTCLKFIDVEKEKAEYMALKHKINHDHVLSFGTGKGCASMIGFTRHSDQPLYLKEPECTKPGIVVHEVGHAVGFYHEQCREDRDQYININLDLVHEAGRKNFYKVATDTNIAPYDVSSTMHYGPKYFSVDGSTTITTRDPTLNFLLGRRIGLSFYDALAANKAYNCSGACPPEMATKCQNGGFLSKNCKCLCPEGIGGDYCEDIDRSWIIAGCGNLTYVPSGKDVIIESPNYPQAYGKVRCIWLIKGPSNTQLKTKVKVVRIPKGSKKDTCYHWLEIRYNLIGQNGPRVCGSRASKEFPLSSWNFVMLRFEGSKGHMSTIGGFKTTIHALPAFNSGDRLFYCDFDDNTCGMVNTSPTPDLQWTLEEWVSRGPLKDHTTMKGKFLVEADMSKSKHAVAAISTPYLFKGGNCCLRFWYYVNAYHLNDFRILIQPEVGKDREIWKLSTNSRIMYGTWVQDTVDVDLKETQKYRITLETTAEHSMGNYAVDDLQFTVGRC